MNFETIDFMICNFLHFSQEELLERDRLLLNSLGFQKCAERGIFNYLSFNPGGYEVLYLDYFLSKLSEKGRAVFILSESFLNRKNHADFRKKPAENGIIDTIIEFPKGFLCKSNVRLVLLLLIKEKRKIIILMQCHLLNVPKRIFPVFLKKITELIAADFAAARKIYPLETMEKTSRLDFSHISDDFFYHENTVELGKICKHIFRGIPPKKTVKGGRRISILSYKFGFGERSFALTKKVSFSKKEIEKYRLCRGDILLSCKGSVKVVIADKELPDMPVVISDNIFVLRVDKEKYHPYVLFYYLRIAEKQEEIKKTGTKGNVYVLKKEDLEKFPVPCLLREDCNELGELIRKTEKEYDTAISEAAVKYDSQCSFIKDKFKIKRR